MSQDVTADRSIHIKTFGCQMNVYDSDRMTGLLKSRGYRFEPNLGKADVIILNTCSIRDKSEHKVLSILGQLKPLKEQNPDKIIGVAGCIGQRLGRTLLQRVPHLDLVFGPDSVDRVVMLVESVRREGKRVLEAKLDSIEDGRSYSQPLIPTGKVKVSDYLTIMKGCDHFCTYCIVPFVRGREKSRSISEIINDVEQLVEVGTREITFLGQNINTYGKGTGEKLSELIYRANAIPRLERIRYVTSHPRDLGQDLIDQFGTVGKLCPALHLPFQSGNNRVLKRMSRLYTREEFLQKVGALKKACPNIALSTDVIVGFPGETEAEFQDSLSLLDQVAFSNVYMFKYSPRPGTRAFSYEEEIPEVIKEERLARVHDLVYSHIEKENRSYHGTRVPVLIESLDKKQQFFTGRDPRAKLVHVLNAGAACVGKTIEVEITESTSFALRGYYVEAPRVARVH